MYIGKLWQSLRRGRGRDSQLDFVLGGATWGGGRFEFTKNSEIVEARIGESKVYMDEGELKIPVLWREALVKGEE